LNDDVELPLDMQNVEETQDKGPLLPPGWPADHVEPENTEYSARVESPATQNVADAQETLPTELPMPRWFGEPQVVPLYVRMSPSPSASTQKLLDVHDSPCRSAPSGTVTAVGPLHEEPLYRNAPLSSSIAAQNVVEGQEISTRRENTEVVSTATGVAHVDPLNV
jgi:hypothetical protein